MKTKYILVGLLFLHIFLLIVTQFTVWPEMLFWPFLMLRGWLPYQNIAIAHTPLLLIELSLVYKLLGVGVWQLKILTWLTILFIDIFVFYLARRFWGIKTAVISLLFYVFLQINYAGNGLWFDLCLAFWGLVIYYFLKSKKYLAVGIGWVLAFLTKQTAFWFLIPIVLKLWSGKNEFVCTKVRLFRFIFGVLIISLTFVASLLACGIFDDFYNWAVNFGIFVLPKAQGQIKTPHFRELIYASIPFGVIPFYYKMKKDWLLPLLAIAGAIGVYPRWELFHFQPALVFLALMFGVVIIKIKTIKKCLRMLLLLMILFVFYSFGRTISYFWKVEDRFVDATTMQVVEYVKENSVSEDKIYVVNYWDNIYALSNRLPAIEPWIPHLKWYLNYGETEKEMLSDLNRNNPSLIVVPKDSKFIPRGFENVVIDNYEKAIEIDNILIYRIIKI